MNKLKELSIKRKIILGVIIAIILGIVFTPNKIDSNEKYSVFINKYFSLLVKGNMYELEKYTSSVMLFKKIGNFNTTICRYNLGERIIVLTMDGLKKEIQETENLSAKQKRRLFNKKMNDVCISYDSYKYYDKYFSNIKILKVYEKSDYETDVTINVFSKILNKYLKMIVTIENDGKGLNMREIMPFPTAAGFLESQPELGNIEKD